jgi:hypothetical protein
MATSPDPILEYVLHRHGIARLTSGHPRARAGVLTV